MVLRSGCPYITALLLAFSSGKHNILHFVVVLDERAKLTRANVAARARRLCNGQGRRLLTVALVLLQV